MEEKERYVIRYDLDYNQCLIDTEENQGVGDYIQIVKLLNQQDKHIKELELLLKADNKMKTNSLNGFEKLRQEKQQLREDLQAKDILVNTYMSVVGTLDNAKQLKQSQKQLAIEKLEKMKEKFGYRYNSALVVSSKYLSDFIDNQIKQLKEGE